MTILVPPVVIWRRRYGGEKIVSIESSEDNPVLASRDGRRLAAYADASSRLLAQKVAFFLVVRCSSLLESKQPRKAIKRLETRRREVTLSEFQFLEGVDSLVLKRVLCRQRRSPHSGAVVDGGLAGLAVPGDRE